MLSSPILDPPMSWDTVNYRPRSESSEGYVFTGVCHSVIFRGGEGGQHQRSMTYPPARVKRSQHLPPARVKGHNTSPSQPGSKVTTPPPKARIKGHNTSPTPGRVKGHNTSPPPPPGRVKGHNTSPTPHPRPGSKVTTPLPPPSLCAGGRYASYWMYSY